MRLDRRRQRHRREQVRAAAGEQGQPVRRRLDVLDVAADFRRVALQALAFGRARTVRAEAIGQLPAQERLESIAPAIVGLQVQIETDDRKRSRLERSEAVELRRQLLDLWHTATSRNCNARDLRLH